MGKWPKKHLFLKRVPNTTKSRKFRVFLVLRGPEGGGRGSRGGSRGVKIGRIWPDSGFHIIYLLNLTFFEFFVKFVGFRSENANPSGDSQY